MNFPAYKGEQEFDVPVHNWTEEELKQAIEDIESGKIKGSLVQVINTEDGEYFEFTEPDGSKLYGTFISSGMEESDYN